jgi:hypothetical protein
LKVEIKKYFPSSEQTFNDGKKRWFVSRLIEKAKDLTIEEMPLSGLNTYNIHPILENMNSFVDYEAK